VRKPVYIFNAGDLERHQNTLRFTTSEGKRFVPVETTSEIHAFGEVDLSTRLLNFLSQNHIPLHVYNYYGYWSGSYMPREQYVSGHLTLRQAEHYMDHDKRMILARLFVRGALANMEKVLGYYARRASSDGLSEISDGFARKKRLIGEPATPEELMALEGGSRELYYKSWDLILKGNDFRFEGRTRRPPQNRINALVSFGNSLMYVTALSEIHRTHLDPRIGFLHTTNRRRYTLNLDVAEVFKPIIVDRVIFTLVNRGALKAKDFRGDEGEGVFLTEKGRKTFLEAYEARLRETVKHPRLGRSVSYRRLIRLDLYKLEKHLLDDETYEPYVSRW
jgi:CRISPR-associated protein Cas1